MIKFLMESCLDFRRRLEETTKELQAICIAMMQKNIVLTDEDMSAARTAGAQVTELELAMPEVMAERAKLRPPFEEFEQLQKELAELDKLEPERDNLEPPEPPASFTEADVAIVLGALHLAAVHTTQPPDEEPEQRGPAWHEAIALWECVLTIVDPKDPSASFELAWSALVAAAVKYLDQFAPRGRRYGE